MSLIEQLPSEIKEAEMYSLLTIFQEHKLTWIHLSHLVSLYDASHFNLQVFCKILFNWYEEYKFRRLSLAEEGLCYLRVAEVV